MVKAAVASFTKVVQKCPKCGKPGPKDLVQGPKRMNWVGYIIVGLLTGGVGLFFFPAFNKSHLEAHCDSCGHTFKPH